MFDVANTVVTVCVLAVWPNHSHATANFVYEDARTKQVQIVAVFDDKKIQRIRLPRRPFGLRKDVELHFRRCNQ